MRDSNKNRVKCFKKEDIEDERKFFVKNLDTGEEYDCRNSDVEAKLNYSYSSIVLKTAAT